MIISALARASATLLGSEPNIMKGVSTNVVRLVFVPRSKSRKARLGQHDKMTLSVTDRTLQSRWVTDHAFSLKDETIQSQVLAVLPRSHNEVKPFLSARYGIEPGVVRTMFEETQYKRQLLSALAPILTLSDFVFYLATTYQQGQPTSHTGIQAVLTLRAAIEKTGQQLEPSTRTRIAQLVRETHTQEPATLRQVFATAQIEQKHQLLDILVPTLDMADLVDYLVATTNHISGCDTTRLRHRTADHADTTLDGRGRQTCHIVCAECGLYHL